MIDLIIIICLIALIIPATIFAIKRKGNCSCDCANCTGCKKKK